MDRATPRIAGCSAAALLVMVLTMALTVALTAPLAAQQTSSRELDTPRTPPHIVVHPRTSQPGPNAKRYCRSWLVQEYRVSGPVIVPRMQCWWQ